MGCFQSKPYESAETKRNAEIEEQLKADKARMKKEVKVLLLGAGESGKSTLLKQMRLINQGSFSEQEREAYRDVIFSNVLQSIQVILEAMEDLDMHVENPELNKQAVFILELPNKVSTSYMPPDVTEAISLLWRDPRVQACHKRAHEFQLNDSAAFYLDDIERIGDINYVPTDQDILRSRTKTTGIVETILNVGDLVYRMVDVGGQRSERRKWISVFEGVSALLFLVALSEYDQQLYEDETVNRMQEALTLCDSIINSKWFAKSSIILFMNKVDLLKKKLPNSPVKKYFDDYRGNNTFEDACEFFQGKFVKLNRHQNHTIHCHFTCATDTTNVAKVMSAVYEDILAHNLRQIRTL